jgi:hypothetical protein
MVSARSVVRYFTFRIKMWFNRNISVNFSSVLIMRLTCSWRHKHQFGTGSVIRTKKFTFLLSVLCIVLLISCAFHKLILSLLKHLTVFSADRCIAIDYRSQNCTYFLRLPTAVSTLAKRPRKCDVAHTKFRHWTQFWVTSIQFISWQPIELKLIDYPIIYGSF